MRQEIVGSLAFHDDGIAHESHKIPALNVFETKRELSHEKQQASCIAQCSQPRNHFVGISTLDMFSLALYNGEC